MRKRGGEMKLKIVEDVLNGMYFIEIGRDGDPKRIGHIVSRVAEESIYLIFVDEDQCELVSAYVLAPMDHLEGFLFFDSLELRDARIAEWKELEEEERKAKE
jgi:hypothetical protein